MNELLKKSIDELTEIELRQVMTYLRLVREVQDSVLSVKRNNFGPITMNYETDTVPIDRPIGELYHEGFFEHHGVKGQRWGVRRDRTRSGRPRRGSGGSRKSSSMSTKELKKRVERLNLEKQYASLNPSDYKKGKAIAQEVLAIGGMAVTAYSIAKSPMVQDIMKAARHGEELIDNFLEHHGVKGQRWGVRNEKKAAAKTKRAQRGAQLESEKAFKTAKSLAERASRARSEGGTKAAKKLRTSASINRKAAALEAQSKQWTARGQSLAKLSKNKNLREVKGTIYTKKGRANIEHLMQQGFVSEGRVDTSTGLVIFMRGYSTKKAG